MPESLTDGPVQGLSALRRFSRPRPPAESCDLCGQPVGPGHQHLIELSERRLVCTCDPCAILFSQQSGAKFRRVPRDVRRLAGVQISAGQWDALAIPIGLAFFLRNSTTGRVAALYPSPAGATESLLTLSAWDDIVRANPRLAGIEADVAALLVNRVSATTDAGGAEYFVAPIDICYGLVGIIRAHWKGFAGGVEVWNHVDQFFTELRKRAEDVEAYAPVGDARA